MIHRRVRHRERRRWRVQLAVAAACVGIGVAGLVTDRLDAVQTRWEDSLQPGVDASRDPEIVVVAFDRATIAALGTGWPVPRDAHAALIDIIGRGAPRVIVYDVLFAREQDGDDDLAGALASQPTVIAEALTLRRADGPFVAESAVRPTAALADAATAVGHANVTLAADTGVVRSLPVYAVDPRGVPIPSLALVAVAVADGASVVPVERPDGVQIGNRLVPAERGELAINWSAALGVDDVTPAIDVLTGAVDPARFEDAVVLVGATEPTLGDTHLVPVDRSGSTAGILVLANAVNTMLTSGYLSTPGLALRVIAVVVVAGLAGLLFARWRLGLATVLAVAVTAAYVAFVTWRFHAAGERWNLVWPVVTTVLVGVALSAVRYVDEIRHRRRAWSLFATYVPAAVVDELADPTRLRRVESGERTVVTVLFCDLRGFTPIAAELDPADVRRLLDHYYEYAVAIIHRHLGTVMQFVGDEVFAVFGAPTSMDDSAAAALATACELQDRIDELDRTLAGDVLPSIRFGIGVHRGSVTTAHVGTSDRRQYSAIGDTVNVGSRLCGAAGAGEIVASVVVIDECAVASGFVSAGAIELKGVQMPMPIARRSGRDADKIAAAAADPDEATT